MGLFSKIGKFFKKIVKGVAKGVKKVVGGVKKIFKKLAKSKILKVLAIAAAVIVTGGAAIGAFGGSFASSGFGAWMVNAGNAITGFTLGGTAAAGGTTLFGTTATAATTAGATGFGGLSAGVTGGLKIGSLLKPFAAAGKFIGGTAGKATDFLKLTDQATRLADPKLVAEQARWAKLPPGQWTSQMPHTQAPLVTAPALPAPPVSGRSELGQFALEQGIKTGYQVAVGYLGGEEEDPRGISAGLANESKDYQDALEIYTAQQGIDVTDIYKNLAHGTGDPGYQVSAALYHQSAFQPVEATYSPPA